MGLENSPAESQRFMEECLVDYRYSFCAPYLDDVIFYSKSIEEHVFHLEIVPSRLREKESNYDQRSVTCFRKR